MRSLRMRLLAEAEAQLLACRADTRVSRRGDCARCCPTPTRPTLSCNRLLAEGMPLERLEGMADDPVTRRARAAALEQSWEGATEVARAEQVRRQAVGRPGGGLAAADRAVVDHLVRAVGRCQHRRSLAQRHRHRSAVVSSDQRLLVASVAIVAIGLDVVELPRARALFARHGDRHPRSYADSRRTALRTFARRSGPRVRRPARCQGGRLQGPAGTPRRPGRRLAGDRCPAATRWPSRGRAHAAARPSCWRPIG